MPEHTVVGFEGIDRATQVLHDLRALQAERTIDLADAVAVYRTDDGRFLVDESVKSTSAEGATLGGLLGILIGTVLTMPITGGASAAVVASGVGGALALGAAGAAIGHADAADVKTTSGIAEDLVRQVGGMIQPGQSALFVLGDTTDPDGIAQRLGRYGGTILRTTLPPEEAQRLQRAIDAGHPDTRGRPA